MGTEQPETPKKIPVSNETNEPSAPTAPAVPDDILQKLSEQYIAEHTPKNKPFKKATEPVNETDDLKSFKVEQAEGLAEPDEPSADDGMSDPATDRAVDDIVAKEGDEVLAAEDAKKANQEPAKTGLLRKIGNFFSSWWHNKWARWITIIILLGGIISIFAIPKSRYAVLNTFGVRCSTSIVAIDDTTQLPLKNVTLNIGGKHAVTDINGVARVYGLKLGKQQLLVQRIAFATIKKNITLGWGSNPLGDFSLHAVGTQYTINITDYLSGKPVANVEATSDGIEALSDKNGKVTLTTDNQDAKPVPITLLLNGYRDEHITLPAANTLTTNIQLVTDREEVFISKQSGKYDLYKMDVDGKNKQVLLPGTGLEGDNMSLIISPAGDEAAFVSTRDNMHDQDGYLLSTLTIIDINKGTSIVIDHANQIQLVDWIDHRLVYSETVAGASAANPNRNRIISYDYATNNRSQLAIANQFNGVLSANSVIYYVVSATDPSSKPQFAKIRPDGTGRQTITAGEIWGLQRLDYNTLAIQMPDGWSNYSIQNNQLKKAGAPSTYASRVYVDAPNGKQSLWIDLRDGKGALLNYSLSDGKDSELHTQNNLTYPVRWLTDRAVIYRVASDKEIADYIFSLDTKQAHKLTDVSRTGGTR